MSRKFFSRKILYWNLLALLLILAAGIGAVQAQSSESYLLNINSLAGGSVGGGYLTSTSYQLLISTGSQVETSSSSAGYQLCTGFVCQASAPAHRMRLPSVFNEDSP